MSKSELTEVIGEWEGYRFGTTGRKRIANGVEEVWLELLPDPAHQPICSGCGRIVTAIHETCERWVQDLPVFEMTAMLLVHRRRVNANPRSNK